MRVSRRVETILIVVAGLVLSSILAIWVAPRVGSSGPEGRVLSPKSPNAAALRAKVDALEHQVDADMAKYLGEREHRRLELDKSWLRNEPLARTFPHHEADSPIQLIPTTWIAGPMLIPTHWDAKLVLVAGEPARAGMSAAVGERLWTDQGQVFPNWHGRANPTVPFHPMKP